MAYEKPEVIDFGSIADHTYSEVLACFCGGSPNLGWIEDL